MLEIILAYNEIDSIRELFKKYTDMLIGMDANFEKYLKQQDYEEEFHNPSIKYGLPSGRLFLMKSNGLPIGCVALRKVDDLNCEMKRLYIRPQFRGNGYSHLLTSIIFHSPLVFPKISISKTFHIHIMWVSFDKSPILHRY